MKWKIAVRARLSATTAAIECDAPPSVTVKTLSVGLYLPYFVFCPGRSWNKKSSSANRRAIGSIWGMLVPYIRSPIEELRANTLLNVCVTAMWHEFCMMDLVDKEPLLLRPNALEGSQRQEPTSVQQRRGSLQCQREDMMNESGVSIIYLHLFLVLFLL